MNTVTVVKQSTKIRKRSLKIAFILPVTMHGETLNNIFELQYTHADVNNFNENVITIMIKVKLNVRFFRYIRNFILNQL